MRRIAFGLMLVLAQGCIVSVSDDGGDSRRRDRDDDSTGGRSNDGTGGAATVDPVDAGTGGAPEASSPEPDTGVEPEGGAADGGADAAPPCESDGGSDLDGDGFTVDDGDCDDCNAQVNPGAYDFPGDGVDQDCSGEADDEVAECDADLEVEDGNALNAARAIGLCKTTTLEGTGWGVISAKYVMADGTDGMGAVSHGLLPGFGDHVTPREGQTLLALSSGTAREPGHVEWMNPNGYDVMTSSETPEGFPIDSPSCNVSTADVTVANDPAALEITLRAPTNANSFQFSFDFYTYEYPTFVCTSYNDFFVALQSPAPDDAVHGNISFDNPGNPVSVNNAFLEVCAPQTAGGKEFTCPQGEAELEGTGFEFRGATGWLLTRSPVQPGEVFTIRFAIWDAGDHVYDSTVLIDRFRWLTDVTLAPTTTRM